MRKLILLGLVLCWYHFPALAGQTLFLDKNQDSYNLNNYAEVYLDYRHKFTLQNVIANAISQEFIPYKNLDYTQYTDVTTWLRVEIANPSAETQSFFIDGGPNRDYSWTLYIINAAGQIEKKTIDPLTPYMTLFYLNVNPHTNETIYLQRYTQGINAETIKVLSPIKEISATMLRSWFIGVNYGVPLALSIYSLFIFIITRDKSYIAYIFFVLSLLSFQILDDGNTQLTQYKFDNWWYLHLTALTFVFTGIAYTLFAQLLLQAAKYSKSINAAINTYIVGAIPIAICSLIMPTIFNFLMLYIFIGFCLTVVLVIITLFKGYKPARYYFLGMLSVMVGIIWDYLAYINIIPGNIFIDHAAGIGMDVDMILQSIGLASRFNLMQQEKERARMLLLREQESNARNQRRAIKYQLKLIHAYERFFPHHFLDILGKKSIIQLDLGDQVEKEMIVLFADIRNFTAILEKDTPSEAFKFINHYLGKVGPIIREHEGFVDRYIGDAIMALFEKSPQQAIEAADRILKTLPDFIQESAKQFPIKIGIGMHYGSVTVGTVGEAERMDGTVISDTVNTASRLEALNKVYDTQIIMSESVLNIMPHSSGEDFKIRYLDHIYIKGKTSNIKIYEMFNVDNPDIITKKMQMMEDYNLGIKYYREASFSAALLHFKRCHEILPSDKVVKMYIARCEKLIQEVIDGQWQPIAKMSLKGDEDELGKLI
jgi:adenylate cyclase